MPEWLTPQIALQGVIAIFVILTFIKGLGLVTKSEVNDKVKTIDTRIDGVENTINTRVDGVEKALVSNEHDTGGKPKTGGG